jgi:pheromone shutdown-related protein TraB
MLAPALPYRQTTSAAKPDLNEPSIPAPEGPDDTTPGDAPNAALHGQPLVEIERDGVHYTLLGTAHVSRASVDAVEALLADRAFDAVAVELCESRYESLRRPESLSQLDLFRVIRDGKVGLVAANLALSAYQRRLAEQLGVEPGAELRAAIHGAERQALPVWRIDREVGVTLRRTYSAVRFWDRMKIMSGLMASVLVDDKVDEAEIERLKQGDILESTFSEFAKRSEPLYRSLIAERDTYMAAALREHADASRHRHVLAVVGAGHLAGLAKALQHDQAPPADTRSALSQLPPPSRWGLWFTIIISVLVFGGFAWGFSQGTDVGIDLVLRWVLTTGLLGALGCTLAGGHPLSIIAAFIASPLTPLHPVLASGTVSALVELTVRRPTVADFGALRDDVGSLAGWWRNRVARVMLNFFLTSFGTAIGVYLAGWRMLERLI